MTRDYILRMTTLREAAQQALEAMDCPGKAKTADEQAAITALRAALAKPEGGGNLPPPLPGDFDHGIGADRFKVVRGAFWWHVLIGDSPTEHGKFRSRASAEKMAADLLREFRNGAFVQHEAALAEPVPDHATIAEWWADKQRKSRHVSYVCPQCYWSLDERKPLTEEEIVEAVREADLNWQAGWTLDEHEPNRFTTLARAIERAHGIGGEARRRRA